MDLSVIEKIVGIGVPLIGLGIAYLNMAIFSQQSGISKALLSHEERNRVDFFQRSVVVLAFGFLAFSFRFIFEQKKEEDINADYFLYGFVAVIVISIVISIILKIKNAKKDNSWKPGFSGFINCLIMISFGFMCEVEILFAVYVESNFKYAIGGGVVAIGIGMLVDVFLANTFRSYDNQYATMKVNMDGKDYYILETKGDNAILGNNKYVSDCTEYKIIGFEELKALTIEPTYKQVIKVKRQNFTSCDSNMQDVSDVLIRKITCAYFNEKHKPLKQTSKVIITNENNGEEHHFAYTVNKKGRFINAKQYYLSIENASTTIEGKEIEIVG